MSHLSSRTFPLLKVSIATDPVEAKKWTWKHETRDIRLLFDNYRSSGALANTFPILSVVQGTADLLERVDLSEKVREAEGQIARARELGSQIRPDEISTTVLHKRMNCAIAIRYSLSRTEIRRLQLKVESVHDFDSVLTILQNLGCYLRDHEGRPPTGQSVEWPTSRPASASVTSSSRISSSTVMPDHEHNQHRPMYSEHFRPASASPQLSQSFSQLQRSSTMHISQFGDRHRPSTPLFPIQEDESFYTDTVMQNIGSVDTKAQLASLSRPRSSATAMGCKHNDRPASITLAGESHASESADIPLSSSSSVAVRPATTSKITIAPIDDDLSSLIPPRRELPFKRPGSRQSALSRDGSTSRPTSSADLPALPQPSFIKPLPIEDHVVLGRAPRQVSSASKEMPNISKNNIGIPQDGAKLVSINNSPIQKPTSVAGTANMGHPAIPSDTGVSSRPSTSISASSKSLRQPADSSNTHSESPSHDTDLCKARTCVGSAVLTSAPMTAIDTAAQQKNLAIYASLPYEERKEMIEKLIVDGISDDGFVTLCEDVYGCWQRIGFGR